MRAIKKVSQSRSDAFNSKSDTVPDNILSIFMIIAAGIGAFVIGYMYLFLLAKFEIGI